MRRSSMFGAIVLACGIHGLALLAQADAAPAGKPAISAKAPKKAAKGKKAARVEVAAAKAPEAKKADEAKSPEKKAEENPAVALAQKVQAFYEKTQDLTADVAQAYTYNAMHRTLKNSGVMQLKKPGMLRWDVTAPHSMQYVIDGHVLWVYEPPEPDEKPVVKKRENVSADALSTATSFLWGKGQLSRDFDIALVQRPEYGPTVLELTPKSLKESFRKLFFAVDPATGLVQKSVVIDLEGNENVYAFSNVKTNTGIPDARFRFEVPKNARVEPF